MKRLVLCVAAVLLGACGGVEPVSEPEPTTTVTMFEVDKLGNINHNSMQDITMSQSEFLRHRQALGMPVTQRGDVEVKIAALYTGVGYTWNCLNDPYLFDGEVKNFKISETGECKGFGAGSNTVMGVGLNTFTWADGSTMYHNTRYARGKAHGGAASWRRIAFHVNSEGGGGCVACFESLSAGQVVLLNDVTKAMGSFVVAKG
jgi:hypothetical protein